MVNPLCLVIIVPGVLVTPKPWPSFRDGLGGWFMVSITLTSRIIMFSLCGGSLLLRPWAMALWKAWQLALSVFQIVLWSFGLTNIQEGVNSPIGITYDCFIDTPSDSLHHYCSDKGVIQDPSLYMGFGCCEEWSQGMSQACWLCDGTKVSPYDHSILRCSSTDLVDIKAHIVGSAVHTVQPEGTPNEMDLETISRVL